MARMIGRGEDAEFLSAYLGEALAVLGRCTTGEAIDVRGIAVGLEPHLKRGVAVVKGDYGRA